MCSLCVHKHVYVLFDNTNVCICGVCVCVCTFVCTPLCVCVSELSLAGTLTSLPEDLLLPGMTAFCFHCSLGNVVLVCMVCMKMNMN